LDDLCKTHDLDADILTERLAGAGYHYMPEQKRFRYSRGNTIAELNRLTEDMV
jgi:hypothetical protein